MEIDVPEAPSKIQQHERENFAQVFNESAFAYMRFRAADQELSQAREEYEKQKPSFQNFPVVRQRCGNKLSTAGVASRKAKETEQAQSQRLDDLVAGLKRPTIVVGEKSALASSQMTNCDPLATDDEALKRKCEEVFKTLFQNEREQFTKQMKEHQARMGQWNLRFEKMEQAQRIMQQEMNNLAGIQGQARQMLDELTQRINIIEAQVLPGESHAAEPTADMNRSVTTRSSLPQLATTLESVRSQCGLNKLALKRCEQGLNDLSEDIRSLNSSIDSVRKEVNRESDGTLHPHASPTNVEGTASDSRKLTELEDKVESMHDVIEERSKELLDEMDRQKSDMLTRFSRLTEETSALEGSFRVEISTTKEQISDSISNHARTEGAIASLENAVAGIRDDLNAQMFSRVPVSQLENQVEGAMMSLRQLTRRVDDQSPEEIVSKINMNLRNVNLSQLQTLQARVQTLGENLNSLRLEISQR